jgi:K+-sensing histidine kinase KdpD
MSQKIALLITGYYADLYAIMKALKVAGRTDAHIHVLQITGELDPSTGKKKRMQEDEVSDLIGLIAWLGEVEGIGISFHVFGEEPEKELIEFLRSHDITCLIAGANDKKSFKQKSKWLQTLQKQLGTDKLWFHRTFQVFVTLPWGDVPFNLTLQQLGKTKKRDGRHK